ncbi:MAG: hypothetical protein JWR69_3842 [Pedosphaera sp.]|nr:hypothetical protein [Pedosphaera sp.]
MKCRLMNLSELHRKLISAAKANPPGDSVPYTFEKRMLARLSGRPALDAWGLWAHGLSRAAGLCVVAALLLAGWSSVLPGTNTETLSQDVQTTLFAAVDNATADAPLETQ